MNVFFLSMTEWSTLIGWCIVNHTVYLDGNTDTKSFICFEEVCCVKYFEMIEIDAILWGGSLLQKIISCICVTTWFYWMFPKKICYYSNKAKQLHILSSIVIFLSCTTHFVVVVVVSFTWIIDTVLILITIVISDNNLIMYALGLLFTPRGRSR